MFDRSGKRMINQVKTRMLDYKGENTMTRFALVFSFVAALFAPIQAAAAPTAPQLPVVGTVIGGGSFTGTFTLTRFATENDAVVAVGTISGTITNAAGIVTTGLQSVAIPVTNAVGTCEILHLDLGPLALDLLGLQVDLSRVILDITAQAGAGNLLGNLLCAVTNLLNDPTGLARLLNQILAIL
jgi:hypothetical protein